MRGYSETRLDSGTSRSRCLRSAAAIKCRVRCRSHLRHPIPPTIRTCRLGGCGGAFDYGFQCYQHPKGGDNDRTLAPVVAREEGIETFVRAHALFPIRSVQLRNAAASWSQSSERLTVTLLGASNFDVSDVELSSISLFSAKPMRSRIEDANADGFLDLTLSFRRSEANIPARSGVLRLTGWLKSGQQFVGDLDR